MSEVQQRPPSTRGRGSSRGGRGGSAFGTRAGGQARLGRNSNGDVNLPYTIEDQSEIGQLKKQYSSQLGLLKDMFPDWSTENLLTALQENNGDLDTTATKIFEGATAQWGEVKKKKSDRPRSKVKEPSSIGANNDQFSPRGVRTARGGFESRSGGRGRGAAPHEFHNGRPARGRGGAPTNGGARQSKDFAEENSAVAWGEAATEAEGESKLTSAGAWENELEFNGATSDVPAADTQSGWGDAPKAITPRPSIIKPGNSGTWASIFHPAPPPPPPVQKKPQPPTPASPPPVQQKPPPPKPASPPPVPQPKAIPEPKEPEPIIEALPPPKETTSAPPAEYVTPEPEEPVALPTVELEPEPEVEPEVPVVPAVIERVPTPPQQPLTEINLEKIEDTAPPPPTMTQASTIASSVPTPSASSSIAPPPPQPTVTTPRSTHAGVVMPKGTPKGTPRMSYRRVLDQQEGVVMPSNHGAVEHTTLQFGSLGLNGELNDEDEVEQAETVSQPPQPSPIAQPVTALPPTGPAQLPVSQVPVTEPLPTPRQAPGLPHPQVVPQQPSQQPPLAPQNMTQQQHMSNQYNRYGIPDQQQQQPQTKPFETFAAPVQQSSGPQPQSQPHQAQTQPQPPQSLQQAYASYAAQLPHQQPSHIGVGVSTTPDQQQQYNYYDRTQPLGFGGGYNNSSYIQQGQSQQDAGANQQRASSGLGGAGEALGQIPTSAPTPGQLQQPTSRYGAAQVGEQSSNHGTPSPAISTIQQTPQPHNPAIQYPGGIPGYGYNHPYYSQFMHQNYYNHPSQFGKHQGMYGYPQAYISPQYSDHSSTPAGLGGFGTPTTQGRESVGLSEYGRMNATASQQQQQSLPQHSSTGAYGSTIPNFLNSRGGLPEQQLGSTVAQQQAVQQAQNDESMKFGENKPPTGPSSTPSIAGQPGRPGSATSGANMGPQHGAQTPGSMYSSHLNHNLHGQQAQHSQYGIGQGQSAASPYSMYSGGYPQYSGQSSGRHANAGWGGYGQH